MIAAENIDNWIGLGLAAIAVVYLLVVLVFPEKF